MFLKAVLLGALSAIPVGVNAQMILRPVCATPIVNDPAVLEAARQNTLARHPLFLDQIGQKFLEKTTTDLVVGAVDTFWVFNFISSAFDRVPAELKATGPLSYVWVSQEESQNLHVDSTVVNTVLDALENKTPSISRDSTKGIVELNRQFFGNSPNVNSSFVKGAGDGKTHFLLCDIKDQWTPGGGGSYVAGFFFNIDVDPNSALLASSNRRDMLYIDTYPGIFLDGVRSPERPLSTLAHELQHLIHWNYDTQEIVFFNEGLAEYSSYLCGYRLRSPQDYFSNTNVSFLGWSSAIADYSRAGVWTLYLAEQFGDNFIRNFTQNPGRSTAGFQNALSVSGFGGTFSATLADFHVANILQDRSAGPAYGYRDTAAVGSKPRLFKNNFGTQASGSRTGLRPFAADYVRFFAAETIQTLVSPTSGVLSVKGIEYRDVQTSVVDVATAVPFQSSFGGSSRSEFVLVMVNTSAASDAGYNYSATGAVRESFVLQLINDDGVSQWAPNALFRQNDTAFVVFDGVDGGKIDSVAFWFQSTGTARLYVRDANPSYDLGSAPLRGLGGAPRMSGLPVNFSVTDTGFMKTVVDLTSRSISSSPDFVIQMIYDGAAPNPLLRRDSSQTVLRSYLSLQDQPTTGRTMYSSFGDFYVRAFLSPAGTLLPPAVPENFALMQNYPNPFNPTTAIAYELPERTRVRLSVFDLLGREVAVLKDGEEDANRYSVIFDGARFSSGVYFYRLATPRFSETRKMLLIR